MEVIQAESVTNPENLSRSELLDITGCLIAHLEKKSLAGRLGDMDTERMRDSKTRLLISAIQTHANILKDLDLDGIEARLSALEGVLS